MPMKYSTLRSYTLPEAIRCRMASCEASVIMLSRPISSVGPQGLGAAPPPVVWPTAVPPVRTLAQTSAHRPMSSEVYIACPPFLVQGDDPSRRVGGPHKVVRQQEPLRQGSPPRMTRERSCQERSIPHAGRPHHDA